MINLILSNPSLRPSPLSLTQETSTTLLAIPRLYHRQFIFIKQQSVMINSNNSRLRYSYGCRNYDITRSFKIIFYHRLPNPRWLININNFQVNPSVTGYLLTHTKTLPKITFSTTLSSCSTLKSCLYQHFCKHLFDSINGLRHNKNKLNPIRWSNTCLAPPAHRWRSIKQNTIVNLLNRRIQLLIKT